MPNSQQIQQILQILLAAGGPIAGLLVNWGVPSGQVNNYLTILLIVLPPAISAIWSIITHTQAAMVTTASNVPGASVTVDATAPQSVKNVAMDQSVPNVDFKKA